MKLPPSFLQLLTEIYGWKALQRDSQVSTFVCILSSLSGVTQNSLGGEGVQSFFRVHEAGLPATGATVLVAKSWKFKVLKTLLRSPRGRLEEPGKYTYTDLAPFHMQRKVRNILPQRQDTN